MKQPYLFINIMPITTATTSMGSDTPIATAHFWSHEGSKIVKNLKISFLEIKKIQSNFLFLFSYFKNILELTTMTKSVIFCLI